MNTKEEIRAQELNCRDHTPEAVKLYKQFFDLSDFNGDDAGDKTLPLALAATYIIGKVGKNPVAFLNTDYHKHAEPSDIVDFPEKHAKQQSPLTTPSKFVMENSRF